MIAKKTKKIILLFTIITLVFLTAKNTSATSTTDGVGVSLTITDAPAQATGGSVPLFILNPPKEEEELPPPVENPNKVDAVPETEGVALFWENPSNKNFDYVRIIKNKERFSNDPSIGELVYEGDEQFFFDEKIVPGEKYFYTIFSRDKNGNYSSGSAISTNTLQFVKKPNTTEEKISELEKMTSRFMVYQYGQPAEILNSQTPVIVYSKNNVIIDTDSKSSAEYLKVTGEEGENLGTYMFSFNKSTGRYQSVVPPLKKTGSYTVVIYKYGEKNTTEISGKGIIYSSNQAGGVSDSQEEQDSCKNIKCFIEKYAKPAVFLGVLLILLRFSIFL